MLHPTVQTNTLNIQITLLRADRSINLQIANRNFIHCIFCFGNIHTDVISIIILTIILETKLCFRKSISKCSKAKLITNFVSQLFKENISRVFPRGLRQLVPEGYTNLPQRVTPTCPRGLRQLAPEGYANLPQRATPTPQRDMIFPGKF